jgi:hypothetical protein
VSKNIFKIYDGRTNFWQWDTNQRLIVLDEDVDQVHYSNRNMNYTIIKDVYTDIDGLRVCVVPNELLKLPLNLVAYACVNGITVKSVKFLVAPRPMPNDYVPDQDEDFDELIHRLEVLEEAMRDVRKIKKFNSVEEACEWAEENQKTGIVVAIKYNDRWIAHMVEDDYSVTPICDCNGELVVINTYDGGDSDGYEGAEMFEIRILDGGGASGL